MAIGGTISGVQRKGFNTYLPRIELASDLFSSSQNLDDIQVGRPPVGNGQWKNGNVTSGFTVQG